MAMIGIVEDHPVVVKGLATALSDAGHQVLPPAASVESIDWPARPDVVICDLNLHRPVDTDPADPHTAPILSGARAIAALVARGWPVLATSGIARREEVLDAVACGARGYIDKLAPTDVFLEAVATVVAGHRFLSSRLAGYFLVDKQHRRLPDDLGPEAEEFLRAMAQGDVPMTAAVMAERAGVLGEIFDLGRERRRLLRPAPRELEVITQIGARGLQKNQAARRLNMTVNTLNYHLRAIRQKYLDSHPEVRDLSQTEAARRWADELGQ